MKKMVIMVAMIMVLMLFGSANAFDMGITTNMDALLSLTGGGTSVATSTSTSVNGVKTGTANTSITVNGVTTSNQTTTPTSSTTVISIPGFFGTAKARY